MRVRLTVPLVLVSLPFFGCVGVTGVANAPGRPTTYQDPSVPDALASVGVESQDVIAMADSMVRDLMSSPQLLSLPKAPLIVIDSEYFVNDSSRPINKDMIMDRIRVHLNRASQGKLRFIARHQAILVEDERQLENAGVVTGATQGETKQAVGFDYRMGGRISSLEKFDPNSGLTSAYYQITFELIERGSGELVWTNLFDFKKSAIDDVVYR